jgi:hypothetical protein
MADITFWTDRAAGRGKPDTVVRCDDCGRTVDVDFGVALAVGWPKCWCNGQTLRLVHTIADIDAATVGVALRRSLHE